jgi:hypothetical protein
LTGLPESAIGHLDLRERHTFVDVASPHAQAVLSKLKRAQVRNRRLKAKLAAPVSAPLPGAPGASPES